MSRPRIRLLDQAEWPADMQAAGDGPLGPLNVMKALMHHPELFRRWSVFANHFLFKSALTIRARETLILRVAWLTNCEYEWSQHVKMSAEQCEFGDAEIASIQVGPNGKSWSDADRALVSLVDSIVNGPAIPERLWDQLAAHWNEKQIIDAIALVGNYVMLAMALNTLNVPPDPNYPGFNDATPARPAPNIGEATPTAPHPPARLYPLTNRELDPTTRDLLLKARGSFSTVNIIDTVARHPDLLRRWLPFFNHCLHKQTLDLRQRELVILRTGWLAGSSYEWAQHVPIALQRGVKPQEIEAIPDGSRHEVFNGPDKALLETVDALMARFTLNDAEWRRIASSVTTPKVLDTIFTVGQYRLVAGLLKGINIQFDSYLLFPPPLT
ncbi:MAG: carboxymuconolactone decarboxylase family protein [Alphaproteobacteria bacterium]